MARQLTREPKVRLRQDAQKTRAPLLGVRYIVFKPYTHSLIGFVVGCVVTSVIYSMYVREVELRDHILLYSVKARDLFIHKDKENKEITCVNYLLIKGDIEILKSPALTPRKFYFSEHSESVFGIVERTISDFESLDPNQFDCENI